MASISLKNIKKTYEDKVTVIEDLNLEIKDKEFVILVGPSGCGKSTTLRMIAGLEEITDGEMYIGDKLVNDVSPKNRDIAMVFQSYALYPHMNVYKNMAFGLKNRKVPKKIIDKKVHEAAKMLDIEQYLNRKPRALSGGQRQRVALGRAMVREPAVFLLDEPLSNLDAKLRTEMRSRISMLHKELQTTFVYVTHDQTEAMTMGDRIVVMKDGKIMQNDTPQMLYNHPQNMFVAGFIGSPQMNFINCKINRKTDGYYALFEDYYLKLPDRMNDLLSLYVEKEVVLGIRPENIKIAKNDSENSYKMYVEIAEMTGSDYYLYGKLGNERIIANVPSNQEVKSDEIYNVIFDVERVHIFDKISENLICD
ncbi:MAG: sn-glycerol-3-phosphate ABC transporter ATP-binding protein UgpC [Clostridia bacterium]|nr:sn-glycerol-3-phosphate ABC transporter ATP-binding protein UgpC [Clostridia bacterium]